MRTHIISVAVQADEPHEIVPAEAAEVDVVLTVRVPDPMSVQLDVPPLTFTTNEARFVTSYVPFAVLVSLPETSSLADTVTAVPVLVLPVM